MEESYIQSRQNDQIKNLVKLRVRKHRDRQERFLIEGLRELGHALDSEYAVESVYYCPELFPSEQHDELIRKLRDEKVRQLTRVSKEAFAKATYRENPDGIIAVACQHAQSIQQFKLSPSPLLLILEGMEKPGNLGAVLRSADGAGADAVILVDCLLDLYNPNAIRASQGLIFSVPIFCTEQSYLARWLCEKQIQCLATTPEAQQPHWDVDYTAPTALLFGSESSGLSRFWLDQTPQHIRIPMAGNADSLNVSATVAVCLYEARRQRSQKQQ